MPKEVETLPGQLNFIDFLEEFNKEKEDKDKKWGYETEKQRGTIKEFAHL